MCLRGSGHRSGLALENWQPASRPECSSRKNVEENTQAVRGNVIISQQGETDEFNITEM
jgi:hypothetical protein